MYLSFVQIVMGYLIPFAFLLADETVSRKAFESKYNLSTAFVHKGMVLYLQHLILIPLGAVLVLHFSIYVTNFLGL